MPYLGEILSVAAALCWACGVILFKRSGESMPPLALNLFKNTIASLLLIPTLLLVGEPFVPDYGSDVWVLLIFSGVVGVTLADTFFFLALNKLGAGLTAVVDTAYTPIVFICSFLLLGESQGASLLVGAALIVFALLLSSRARPLPGRKRRDIVEGTFLALFGMVLMAVGIVIAKPVLNDVPFIWASAVRVGAGALGLLPLIAASRQRKQILASLRPSRAWRFAVPGATLGTYMALVAWVGGMKYTDVSRAAVLNQLSTIFIFVLAIIFLKEPVSRRRLVAIVMAVGGALLAVLG